MSARRVLLLGLVLLGAGCPSTSHDQAPTRCTKLNQQCSLGGGVLGVCSESLCPAGQTGPCMKCTSQH